MSSRTSRRSSARRAGPRAAHRRLPDRTRPCRTIGAVARAKRPTPRGRRRPSPSNVRVDRRRRSREPSSPSSRSGATAPGRRRRRARRGRPAVARRRAAPRRAAPRAQAPPRVRPRRVPACPARDVRPAAGRSRGSGRGGRSGSAGLAYKAANSRYLPGRRPNPQLGRGRPRRLADRSSAPRSCVARGPQPGGTVGRCPAALSPAIRDEIARLGRADIMVGIPSFKNAATIGYVVRAAQAGLVQYFPDLKPVLVNSDAGSPDGTQRVVVETEPPDYVEQILLVRPTNKLDRVSLTYPEIDGVGGKGAALRTIFEIAAALEVQALVVVDSDLRSIVPGVDRAPRRPDPQGRLRLRRAALRALQVRRDDHEHRHLPADPGALRPPDPAADRRRLRRLRRPRQALPRARRLDRGHQQVRDRHLDDDVGPDRRLRGLPGAAGREGPRPEGPGLGPRADVPPGRRHDPAPRRDRIRITGSAIRGSHDVPAYGFERIIDPPPLEVNTIRLLTEFHGGSLTVADTWAKMLAPDNLETVLALAREAGKLADAAQASSASVARASTGSRRRSRWPRRSPPSTSPTTCGRASSTTS